VSTPSAGEAREEAQAILDESRFHEHDLPRPLHGVLDWLGDRVREVREALDAVLPGDDNVVWLALASLALVSALIVALRLIRARGPAVSRAGRTAPVRGEDPARLEREADEAERAGELERALRLRFRAGVLRLVERRVLDDPAAVTTGTLVRRLRSDPFTLAAASFDEVVYGRRAPTQDDTRLAREGWRAVLAR
jgi:Domain of unknown function (DUF4129)